MSRYWVCPHCQARRRKSAQLQMYSSGRIIGKVPAVGCLACGKPLDYRELVAGRYDCAGPADDAMNKTANVWVPIFVILALVLAAWQFSAHEGAMAYVMAAGMLVAVLFVGVLVASAISDKAQAAALAQDPEPEEDVASLEPAAERKPLTEAQMALVQKLIDLGRKTPDAQSSSTYLNVGRQGAIELGRALHELGGHELMLRAHEDVVAALGGVAGRELEVCWSGIGQWAG